MKSKANIFYYRPQRSGTKVIFSQASVILLTGWGGVSASSQGGASSGGRCFLPQFKVLPPSGCFLRGECFLSGGAGGGTTRMATAALELSILLECILVVFCLQLTQFQWHNKEQQGKDTGLSYCNVTRC